MIIETFSPVRPKVRYGTSDIDSYLLELSNNIEMSEANFVNTNGTLPFSIMSTVYSGDRSSFCHLGAQHDGMFSSSSAIFET